MDIWSADSGSGGSGPSGLHLHHHGGLPRSVDLPRSCCVPKEYQGCLPQAVEDIDKDRSVQEQEYQRKEHSTHCNAELTLFL